jgi:CRP-like cAMP-binding protein
MLRSHDAAYTIAEEKKVKGSVAYVETGKSSIASKRLLLFATLHEALVFCENGLIERMGRQNSSVRDQFFQQLGEDGKKLSAVFGHILGSDADELRLMSQLDGMRYHSEIALHAGQELFAPNVHSDAFYVILKGAVAVAIESDDPRHDEISRREVVSGAGLVRLFGSSSNLLDAQTDDSDDTKYTAITKIVLSGVFPVASILGYVDFLLDRPRTFRAVCTEQGTIVAKITIDGLAKIRIDDPVLDGLVQRVLLQASLLDLANCSCKS